MEGMNVDRELSHDSLKNSQVRLSEEMVTIKDEFGSLEKKILKFAEKSITIGNYLSQYDSSIPDLSSYVKSS